SPQAMSPNAATTLLLGTAGLIVTAQKLPPVVPGVQRSQLGVKRPVVALLCVTRQEQGGAAEQRDAAMQDASVPGRGAGAQADRDRRSAEHRCDHEGED